MESQVGTDDDNRAPGVVYPLAQKVLPEPPLLTFQHVRERLQWSFIGASDGFASSAVVEQDVYGFLQHSLLIANDNLGCIQLLQAPQTVIAINHPAIEVIEVTGGEPPPVKGNEGTQIRRQHRNHLQNHPLRLVSRLPEGVNHLKPLGQLLPLGYRVGLTDFLSQLLGKFLQLNLAQQLLYRFCAYAHLEALAVLLPQLAIPFFAQQFVHAQRGIARINHNIAVEIENFLQFFQGEIKEVTHLAGQTLQKPYMGNGGCQFYMAHAFSSHFGLNYLNPTFFADYSPMFHTFVLAAIALVVLSGPKDLGTKQAITLGLESPVIDGLRLLDLSIRPFPNFLR